MNERNRKIFERDGGADFAHTLDVDGTNWRFRVNLLQQLGHVGLVARRVNNWIPNFEGLNLPPSIEKLCKYDQGMVLLGRRHRLRQEHHDRLDAQLDQPALPQAHPHAGRPDRIHVHRGQVPDQPARDRPGRGRLRHRHEARRARRSRRDARGRNARQGNVHDGHPRRRDRAPWCSAPSTPRSAATTIGRILDLFPQDMHSALRSAIAFNMRGIVAQKLLKSIKPGVGRVPTVEIMIFNANVQKGHSGRERRKAARHHSHRQARRHAGLHDEPQATGRRRADRPRSGDGSGAEPRSAQDGAQGHRSEGSRDYLMRERLNNVAFTHGNVVAVRAANRRHCSRGSPPVQPNRDGEQVDPAADAAAEPAPAPVAVQQDKWNDAHSVLRMKQPFFFWPKLLAIWLLFLIWVKSADWVNRDTQIFDLAYGKWNPIVFFPCPGRAVAFCFSNHRWLRKFLAGSRLVIGDLPGDVRAVCRDAQQSCPAARKGIHAGLVPLRDRPFGQQSRPQDFGRAEGGIRKGSKGRLDGHRCTRRTRQPGQLDHGPPIARLPRSSRNWLPTWPIAAATAQFSITRSSRSSSGSISTACGTTARRATARSGDVMLAVMKTLANLNATERRKKQEGKFAAKYNDHSYVCPMTSQGVPTGERVVVQLLGGYQRSFKSYEDLGMRAKLGRAMVGTDGPRQGDDHHRRPARGRRHHVDRRLAHGDRPTAARLRVHRGRTTSRARHRKHRGHDVQCGQGRNAGQDSSRADPQISERLRTPRLQRPRTRPSCCWTKSATRNGW